MRRRAASSGRQGAFGRGSPQNGAAPPGTPSCSDCCSCPDEPGTPSRPAASCRPFPAGDRPDFPWGGRTPAALSLSRLPSLLVRNPDGLVLADATPVPERNPWVLPAVFFASAPLALRRMSSRYRHSCRVARRGLPPQSRRACHRRRWRSPCGSSSALPRSSLARGRTAAGAPGTAGKLLPRRQGAAGVVPRGVVEHDDQPAVAGSPSAHSVILTDLGPCGPASTPSAPAMMRVPLSMSGARYPAMSRST